MVSTLVQSCLRSCRQCGSFAAHVSLANVHECARMCHGFYVECATTVYCRNRGNRSGNRMETVVIYVVTVENVAFFRVRIQNSYSIIFFTLVVRFPRLLRKLQWFLPRFPPRFPRFLRNITRSHSLDTVTVGTVVETVWKPL